MKTLKEISFWREEPYQAYGEPYTSGEPIPRKGDVVSIGSLEGEVVRVTFNYHTGRISVKLA